VAIDNSLDLLRGFNYYTFNYKPGLSFHESGKESVGIIAQDVQPQFKHVIIQDFKPYANNEETYMGVNYIKFLPIIINSLKTLSTRVKELSTKLE
jgi:hypothetical protein